jgi:hypothetical protein
MAVNVISVPCMPDRHLLPAPAPAPGIAAPDARAASPPSRAFLAASACASLKRALALSDAAMCFLATALMQVFSALVRGEGVGWGGVGV